MDEEVILDLFNRVKSKGYTKDINQFKELLSNDIEVLQDNFNYVKSKGYTKSIDDFKVLVGVTEDVKKKDASALGSGTSVGFDTETFFTPAEDQFAQPQVEQTFYAPEQQITQDIAVQEGKQEQERVEKEQERVEEDRLKYIKDETRPEYEALKDRLSKVDIANKPEEKLVPELNYLFEDYGFKFEEAKAGANAVKVIAPNGQEKVIDYGTILEQMDPSGLIMEKGLWARLEEAMFGASEGYEDELKKFIKENRKLNENIDFEKKKFITDKEVKDFTNNFNRDAKVYISEYKALQQEAEEISNRYKNVTPGTEQYNNYLEEVKVFEGKQKRLNELNTKLREQGKNYDKYVGEYAAMRVEQGSVYGQIIDSAKSGLGGAAAFLTDVSITAGGSLIGMSDEALKEFKYGEEEKFVNPFSGKATSISRDMDKGAVERVKDLALIGGRMSSKEYLEDVQQADLFSGKGMLNVLYGVAEFVPATALAGAAGTVALSGQYVMEEMNDNPKFDNISEVEKAGVALAIGAVVGKLEQVGFKNIMESKLLGPISTQIATKVLRRNPATMRTFNEYVEQEVKSLMAKGALKMGAGFVAEFETGAAQETADILLKGVYNEVKGSELFDSPDDVLNQIIMGGIAEGMGGAYMATPGAMSTALRKNQLSEVDNATFDIFEQMSKDSEYLNMVTNKLNQQVVNQEITKEDRDRILSDYNRLNGAMQKMPDGIKTSQKKQLLGLYMEHQKITDAMKGNDDVFNKRAKEEKLNIEKRIDGLLKENKIETDVEETLNTQPEETKVFYAEKLEDIPEQHRDNATLVENDGSEITFREKTLGLPIGKEKKVNVGEYYTYTLNGNEIEQVVEAETETETVDESQDSLLDSLAADIESKGEVKTEEGEIADFPAQRKVVDALDTEVEIDGKKGFLKQDGERIIFETTEVDPEVQKEIDRLESSKRRTEKSEKMRGFDVSKAQLNKQYDEQIAKLKEQSRTRQVDLGNKNDLMFSPLSDIGATETQLSEVEKVTFEGKKFKAPPIQTTKGDYISGEMELVSSKVDKKGRRIVTVKDSKGLKRKFTGETADQIIKAYKTQQPEPKGGFFSKRPPQGTVKVSDNVAVIGGDSKLSPSKKAKYDRIVNMAQKAIDALSGVFPDLKILIHTNESTFEEEIGDIARGAFDPATNTIHINLPLAKSTTVGHEVLHAILVNRLKRDRKIAIAVNKMIDSIKKSVPKDVAEELDAFVENYKGSMKNEEYIAELFGILSDRYNSLPNKAKRAIRDFIRAIQDLFNLPKSATIRDQEVFDFITTMARKVGQGEIVQESDLELIEDVDKEVKAKVRKEEPEVRKQKVNPKIEKLKQDGLYEGILNFIKSDRIELAQQLLEGQNLTLEEFISDLEIDVLSEIDVSNPVLEDVLEDVLYSSYYDFVDEVKSKIKSGEGQNYSEYFKDFLTKNLEDSETIKEFIKSTFKRKDPNTGEPTSLRTEDGYSLARIEGGQYINDGMFNVFFESFDKLIEYVSFTATELTLEEETELRNDEDFKQYKKRIKDTPSVRKQKFDGKKNYEKWKGDNVELEGTEIQDAKTGEPIVVKVYHGTTNEFYEFDASVKGNMEAHLGKLNYFTSDYQDASGNYQSEGPDLTIRVEDRSERLEQDLMDEYGDVLDKESAKELSKIYGLKISEGEDVIDVSRKIAEKELVGTDEKVLDLYVKLNNPAVIGKGRNFIDVIPEEMYADSIEDAAQEIAEEYDVTIEEAKEDYSYEVRERAIDLEGIENPLIEALQEAIDENTYDGENLSAAEILVDFTYDDEVDLNQLEKAVREGVAYAQTEDGEMAASQIVGQMFKNLGYDGIILTDVSQRFRNMGLGEGTSHVHVFDEFNNQIKLADGSNVTFGETADIRFQKVNPVQQFIKNARAKGVTVSQIKDYLKRKKGYTQAEVDALFPKPKKKKKHTQKSLIELINEKAKNTTKGNVSVRTTKSLIKKTKNLDYTNEKSVEAFAERVAKIYDRAGTIQEINTAKSNRTNAKKNLSKSKLGASARGFVDAANKILSIKVDFIPIELLEEYNEVMAPLAKREKVKIIDIDTAKMQDLLVKIQEEMEEIAEAEVEKNPTKAEKNRKDNIKNIKSRRGKIKPNLSNKFDNDFAEFLLGITDAQLEEMSAANIDVLKNLYSQIEQGYLSTSLASEIKKEVDGKIEGGEKGILASLNLKKAGKFYINSMAKIYTKLRGVFSDDTNLLTLIRSTPLTEIDTLLGNFNAKDIYNKTFGKLASAKEKYDFELANIMAKLDKFNDLISGGKVFKALNNQQLKSKFRIMASMLQDEFEANPGAKGVASAIEYIDATVKKLERGGKKDRMEADILLELKKEIEDKGISLSEREVKGKKILQEINNDISEKFMFVAALRGQTPRIYNSYIHHSALYSLDNQQSLVESQSNALMDPSTKAGTINERSGNKVISFDPAFSTLQGVKQTLLDFHMTQPLKEVRASIAVLENSDKKDVREVGIALDKALKEALEIVLSHNLSYYGMAEKVLDNIRRLSYYATLASVPRAAAELGSNMSYALLSNPKSFTLGSTKYKYLSLNVNGAKLMNQVGSTITTKNYSKESLSGSRADSATFNRSAFNNSKPKGRIKEVMQFIAENTLVGPLAVKATNVIAEKLISTPDLAVARPLWFGTFFGELESLTGKKFSKKQILEMAEGKSPLLKTYKKEVEQARVKADRENVQMSGSSNAFDSILKDQIRNTGKKSSTLLNMYRVINTYMARFVKNEYNTFKSAIYALFNSGDISRPQAIALTVAVTTRMTGYMVLYTMFKDMFFSAFDDDDDEKDTDYGELAKRQLAGSFVTLMTRRSLGNIPYLPIALTSEYVNENYLEDLRNGKDYDPFENSLVYSPVNLTDLKTKEPYDLWLAAFGGPFSPMLKSASRMHKVVARMHTSRTEKTREKYRTEFKERMLLELAGNFGLVPFYKDIRTAKLKKLFEDSGNKKSSFNLTDAEKKKYMPELYKMEKQIEKEFKSTEEYKELKKIEAETKKEREEMLKSMFE